MKYIAFRPRRGRVWHLAVEPAKGGTTESLCGRYRTQPNGQSAQTFEDMEVFLRSTKMSICVACDRAHRRGAPPVLPMTKDEVATKMADLRHRAQQHRPAPERRVHARGDLIAVAEPIFVPGEPPFRWTIYLAPREHGRWGVQPNTAVAVATGPEATLASAEARGLGYLAGWLDGQLVAARGAVYFALPGEPVDVEALLREAVRHG